ncbi:MAG: hypothetical protein QXM76_02885 [Zestosphaera sp.]
MWFAHVDSPLGSNIRVRRRFVIAHSYTESELKTIRNKVSGFLNLRTVETTGGDVNMIYDVVAVDPDVADLIREGVNNFVLAEIA